MIFSPLDKVNTMENVQNNLNNKSIFSKISDNKFQILFILVFPIILFFVKNDWIFDNPYATWIDPWVYNGYFLNFQQYPSIFGLTYYGDRIPWILCGFFVNLLFSPLLAQYVLHLTFFIIALFSFYMIVMLNFDSKIAFFTSILMGTYTLFLQEIGTNYITGSVITFLLITLLMMTISAKSVYWKQFLLFSGIFFTLMCGTNIFALIFTPTIILYFIFLNRSGQKRSLVNSSFWFIIGCVLITIILGIFNYILIGHFIFFESTIKYTLYYATVPNPWYQSIYSWIFSAYWLYVPLLILINCFIYFSFKKDVLQKNQIDISSFFQLNFILVFGLFVLLTLKGNSVLQFSWYADYLIPVMFFAFAAQLSIFFNKMNKKEFLFLSICEICIMTLPFWIFYIPPIPGILVAFAQIISYALILFWIIFTIVYILYIKHKVNLRALLVSLIILLAIIALFNSFIFTSNYGEGFDSKENGYLAVTDSVKIIKEKVPDQNVKFWYNFSERKGSDYYGGLFNSVNGIYLWGYTYISQDYPNIEQKNLDDLFAKGGNQQKIVIMSTQENLFENTNQSLNTHGYCAVLLSQDRIQRGKIDFNLLIIQLEKI